MIKNNKTNITSFKILQKGGAVQQQVNGKGDARPGMTPDQWAEKDRLDRWSKECNTCFMGIMGAASTAIINQESKLYEVFGEALDWAIEHFKKPSEAAKAYQVVKPGESADKSWDGLTREPGEFKNLGEFLTRATKELKLTRDAICEKLSLNDVSEIKDFAQAWKDLIAGGAK